MSKSVTAKAHQTSYSASEGFAPLLKRLGASLAVSSYQMGSLLLMGNMPDGRLSLNERHFQRTMGIKYEGGSLWLATLFQLIRLENMLAPGQQVNGIYDTSFMPRATFNTGAIDVHDIGILADGRPLFVNTKFNCLATLSEKHSFTPVWKPAFISAIAAEDRCHLNGLAMENGKPRYVTCVSETDSNDAWREQRESGGIVIDVRTNEIICRGLSMPHSPRLHEGKLWLLNAGRGELGYVENKKFVPVAFTPGFGRGLALMGGYAFIGLSKPRYHHFEGLALDTLLTEKKQEAFCGVQVVELASGKVVEWFRAEGTVQEIFDVALLPGIRCPMSVALHSDEAQNLISHERFTALS